MIDTYYTISPIIKESLRKIDQLRQSILTFPLSRGVEARLRWEALHDRIFWNLTLENVQVEKEAITTRLQKSSAKKVGDSERLVEGFILAYQHINYDWYVNAKNIEAYDATVLYSTLVGEQASVNERSIGEILSYIQAGSDHPVIQAGVVMFECASAQKNLKHAKLFARLMGYLFLYKYGYDFRQLLVLEEYWRKNIGIYTEIVSEAAESKNITMWLTYYTKTLINQLEKITQSLTYPEFKILVGQEFWQLNDRQKSILLLLDEPGKTISNREIQKKFKISQITASRDLSHMLALKLLIVHGKGRSVRYSKL